ncbi:RNA polymerase sigma-70 factor [Aurantibacter crassamenti]|uniref:RNA polymerase sigma factor n=1 Tax=Aurantibacter crassamenti TaxID=1837375 RepID=UPI001939E5AC|nr:RNA polymerase sigma-70 factor [Aurantibacter crassamenti]MBM1105469.1 RNA polymerase sigma-70 factor [Aurantibacter crassamenti]
MKLIFADDILAVISLKEGNRSAFKYFFDKYYHRLVAYIMVYSGDKTQSEDIVQKSFITLWENRTKLEIDKSPISYLYVIAYNNYLDSVKNKKKQERLLNQIRENALRDRIKEDSEALEIRINKMKEVIEKLPPKCKRIIEMNKVQGIKYKDISQLLGISIKTVESQMRIAFIKIREAFKEDRMIFFMLFKSY